MSTAFTWTPLYYERQRKGIWHKIDDPLSKQPLPITTCEGSRATYMVIQTEAFCLERYILCEIIKKNMTCALFRED